MGGNATRRRWIAATTGSASSTSLYQTVPARQWQLREHPRHEAFEETMSYNQQYHNYTDTPAGLKPILVDEETGEAISLDPQACRARSGGLKCCLDVVRKLFKSKHVHR